MRWLTYTLLGSALVLGPSGLAMADDPPPAEAEKKQDPNEVEKRSTQDRPLDIDGPDDESLGERGLGNGPRRGGRHERGPDGPPRHLRGPGGPDGPGGPVRLDPFGPGRPDGPHGPVFRSPGPSGPQGHGDHGPADPFGPPRGPHGDWNSLEAKDPELFKLLNAEMQLDRESHELAQQYRRAPTDKQPELKKSLEEKVAAHFRLRQKRRQFELKRSEEELQRLRESIERRNKAGETIVKDRVSMLLGLDEGF